MTDAQLLAEYARTGSREAYAEIATRHSGLVYATCRRVLGERPEAEDAAQAVFLVLLRKGRKLGKGTVLAGWLHRTARNCAWNLKGAAARRARLEREAATMREQADREVSWDEVRPHLDAALDSLPGAQRQALVLRYLRGLPRAQVARELGCGERTAESRLRLGLAKLRERLAARGAALPAAALAGFLGERAAESAPTSLTASIQALGLGTAAATSAATATAEAIMKAMFWMKVKVYAAAVAGAAILGIGGTAAVKLAAAEPAKRRPAPSGAAPRTGPGKTGLRRSMMDTGAVSGAEHRLGSINAMFIIDDAWSLGRYRRVLRGLPKLDTGKRMLIVLVSWDTQPRTIKEVVARGDTLVVRVEQKRVVRKTKQYIPPQFVVAERDAWKGPIRFEVNGSETFTIWKGKRLKEESGKARKALERVYEGGQITSRQLGRFGDMRLRPLVGDLFEFIGKLGSNDANWGAARNALAAIGGPEVVDGCRKALKSKKDSLRHAAVLILRDFGLPGTRELVHGYLRDSNVAVRHCAIEALRRIGLAAEDAGALGWSLTHPAQGLTASDAQEMAAFTLGSMGPKAKAAVPALEKALGDKNRSVRIRTAAALWKVTGKADKAVPVLDEVLRKDRRDIARWHAVEALSEMGRPAIPTLERALKDRDAGVRSAAAKALKKIRGRPPKNPGSPETF